MNIYKSKKEYDDMPLPENVNNIVEASILKAEGYRGAKFRKKRAFKVAGISVAAVLVFFVALSNISSDFVMAASRIPILGQLVSVMTWQDYEEENEVSITNVKMPQIKASDSDDLENRINNEIRVKINDVIQEAEERAKEYKQAYIDTGGTEAEWHQMEIDVDYEVMCNDNYILSFVITKSESFASVYTEKFYYNIDLETGKDLSLSELLGPDYIERANKSIVADIEKRVSQGEIFFGYGQDEWDDYKFQTISDETKFYVNGDQNVVIVFDKYEIAPGYMGFVEFVVE